MLQDGALWSPTEDEIIRWSSEGSHAAASLHKPRGRENVMWTLLMDLRVACWILAAVLCGCRTGGGGPSASATGGPANTAPGGAAVDARPGQVRTVALLAATECATPSSTACGTTSARRSSTAASPCPWCSGRQGTLTSRPPRAHTRPAVVGLDLGLTGAFWQPTGNEKGLDVKLELSPIRSIGRGWEIQKYADCAGSNVLRDLAFRRM
jgi:hypothetical protein